MLKIKKILLEKNILIFSVFSFIYLWDIKYNIYFEARYLIVLYFFYIILNKNIFNTKYIFYVFIIFILLFLHQYLNIFYENNNSEIQILTKFNNILIDRYNNEVKKIYDLNNFYNFRLFSPISGLIICFIVSKFIIKHNIDYYNLLFISFIILFFIFDVVINIFSINQISSFSYDSLCVSRFTIEKKFLNIFNENSHYGMIFPTIIIFIIYRLSKNFNFVNIILLLVLFITIYFNLSATIIAGSILTILVLNIIELKRLNNKFRFFSIIVIIYFSLMNSLNTSCSDRLLAGLKIINNSPIINTITTQLDTQFDTQVDTQVDTQEDNEEPNTQLKNNQYEKINKKKYKSYDEIYKKYSNIETNKHLFMETASKIKNNNFDKYILNRYIDIGISNLTIEVLINSLNISINSIIDRPLGWGLNRFHSAFIYYQPRLPVFYSEIRSLNFNDGVSNLCKLLVEFGVFSFVLFYMFVFFAFSSKINLEDKIFLLPFIITQMIRGAGYFNGGFMLITMLILFKVFYLEKKR